MNSSHRFTLDMQSVQSQISIPASLYDTARTLHISFTDGGKPYFIETGCLAKLTITRPSGSKLHEFCAIDRNEAAVYPFAQNPNTASEEGIHECELTLYSLDGEQITSPRFSMVVSERVVNKDDNNGITDESIGIVDSMIKNEQDRRKAEMGREDAEAIRVASEEGRATSEQGRVSAEEARVTAEEERVSAYKKVEYDTAETVRKILAEQESIIAIQELLIAKTDIKAGLRNIINIQESYIGGDQA